MLSIMERCKIKKITDIIFVVQAKILPNTLSNLLQFAEKNETGRNNKFKTWRIV